MDLALAVPAAATLAMMLWGIRTPSYWGDEIDTVSAVSRSLPQLFGLLGHIDAVHGLYYLLLWPVVKLAGAGEFATRLPSALAMAAAALGVSALAGRLRSRRAALLSGLVFAAALPTVTQQGHDARPYAMVSAAVVLASYLLLRATDDPRPGRFAGYGAALVLVGYLQVFGLLIVPAHAITLVACRGAGNRPGAGVRSGRAVIRGWLTAVVAAAIVFVPLAVFTWLQRGAVAWIDEPGWYDLRYLLAFVAGGSLLSAAGMALLAVAGATRSDAGAPAGRLLWLALPWLIVPPAVLWTVSLVHPAYSARYITFCLPATALLVGAGLASLGRPLAAAALAIVLALSVPGQLGQWAVRVPGRSTEAAVLQAASQFLAAHERPGDDIVYPGGSIPPVNLAYPDGFGRLRDLSLAESGAAIRRLYSAAVPLSTLQRRERGAGRIWVAEITGSWSSPATYIGPGFRLAAQWKSPGGSIRLWLYTRAGEPPSPGGSCRQGELTCFAPGGRPPR